MSEHEPADAAAPARGAGPGTARSTPAGGAGSRPPFASDLWARALTGLAAAVVGGLVRGWQVRGKAPAWWQDSTDYLAVGGSGWGSVAGSRPPLISWLVHLTGGQPGTTFVTLNVVVAAVAWGWLAAEVASELPGRLWRVVGAAVVVGFSLVTPIALWDRSVLSESMSTSLLAALVAGGLWALRRPGRARLSGLVLVALAWVLLRDSSSVALLVLAVGCAATWWWGRRSGAHRPLALAAAVALSASAGLAMASSSIGERDALPIADVMAVRILPYPERVEWFIERGMPEPDRWRQAAATASGSPPLVGTPRDDPTLDGWWRWVRDDGRQAFLLWLLTHPAYAVTEPLADPERAFNNADGDLLGYRAADMPTAPVVSEVLWWPTPLALVVAGSVALGWWRCGHPRSRLLGVAGTCVVVAGPVAFVAWHTGGMETARHIFLASVALRLGALLGLLGLLAVTTWPGPRHREPAGGEVPTSAP